MIQRIGTPLAWTSLGWGVAAWLWTSAAVAQPTVPEPPPPVEPWYEALELRAFADTYASFNFNLPKRAEGANELRAYDTSTGFALAWAGADVAYEPAPVGGAISLRFGPAAERYADSCLGGELVRCDGDVLGLGILKQAYASWRPVPRLRLDLGKFDTPFGAEVAESQDDLLYSRGVVYTLGEPAFHTGLRATAALLPSFSARVLVVNGWNNSLDNNTGKTFGAQLLWGPTRTLKFALGWLGGPEQTDFASITCAEDYRYNLDNGACWPAPGAAGGEEIVDRGRANDPEAWRQLVNLVGSFQPVNRLQLALDVIYGQEGVRRDVEVGSGPGPDGSTIVALGVDTTTERFYGGALTARYALTHAWAVAGRGEYYADPGGITSGTAGLELVTATLGLELSPTPALQLRLEGRGDVVAAADGTEAIFLAGTRNHESSQLTTTLSAVVRTF